jgi:hypothetical protein
MLCVLCKRTNSKGHPVSENDAWRCQSTVAEDLAGNSTHDQQTTILLTLCYGIVQMLEVSQKASEGAGAPPCNMLCIEVLLCPTSRLMSVGLMPRQRMPTQLAERKLQGVALVATLARCSALGSRLRRDRIVCTFALDVPTCNSVWVACTGHLRHVVVPTHPPSGI